MNFNKKYIRIFNRLFFATLLLTALIFLYGYHFFGIPFEKYCSEDGFILLIGIGIVAFSIIKNPIEFMETLGSLFFKDKSLSHLNSIFVGLVQYFILQLLGWYLIKQVEIDTDIFKDYKYIDGPTIVQTAGTIASLIFAAFQMITASAENQYEVKGRLRFDKNDELYFYLRLTLSSAIGAFFWQKTSSMSKTLPYAQAILILALLFLIPLISIIFKSFTPEAILNKSKRNVKLNINKLFLKLKKSDGSSNFQVNKKYKIVFDSLMQTSAVASWAFRHKLIIPFDYITIPFQEVFDSFFDYLYEFENNDYNEKKNINYLMEALHIRNLEIIKLRDEEVKNMNFSPENILERENIMFLESNNFQLQILYSFFLPFRIMIFSSLATNGFNYAKLLVIIVDLIKKASKIETLEIRRGVYLMMLGDFTDGVLTLPPGHNATMEVCHLWFLLLKAKTELKLDADCEIVEQFEFCRGQFLESI